jgi:transposase-like protein
MLTIILEGQEEGLSTEEICRKHGIKRHVYYAWKKKLTWAGLELLGKQMSTQEPLIDKIQKLRQTNVVLGQKVRRLEKAKAMSELKCNWLLSHLDAVDDPSFQRQLSKIREQLPLQVEPDEGE